MVLPKNRIHQGDCVKLLAKVETGAVDLVFADPPFNIGYDYDVYDDRRDEGEYIRWCQEWISGVHRVLKPDGTFWLAIGDEYAAELKILAQRMGFHCRSWVIWYYTFGVNCVNGFSRSHTHLFHFVKDPTKFTFNRNNPQIRVQSARQLVYADNRANPNGRLPDNTWITRPQDAPLSFSPSHDTWYFARVAGTFKEREGFHGCQMPEQLLARVIRASSNPQELVLDPFGGSGTTLVVAKKLGRRWLGFELSKEYAARIEERLNNTQIGAPIDGPVDPIESAPSTHQGKRKKSGHDESVEKKVVDAFLSVGNGYPVDYLLCHKELNADFARQCRKSGLGGSAYVWNRFLLRLRKSGKLPRSTQKPTQVTPQEMDEFGFASEVAWRLLAIDYCKSLDEILCSPDFADEFDRLARMFGPTNREISSLDLRRAAISIRKRSKEARNVAESRFAKWKSKSKKIPRIQIGEKMERLEVPGVFVLNSRDVGFYVGESVNMRERVEELLSNETWRSLEPDSVSYVEETEGIQIRYALKSALAQREQPLLNCRLLMDDSELPESRRMVQ